MEPKLIAGNSYLDDRGVLAYNNNVDLSSFGIKRTYMITGHRGFIRAWHGHKIESKLMQVASGQFRIRLVNMETSQQYMFYLRDNGDMLYVPSGFYNGLQHLTDNSTLLVYSNTTVDQSKDDDYRKDYRNFSFGDGWSLENYR